MDQKEDAIMYFAEAFSINNKNYYAAKYVKEKPDFDMSKDMNLYRKLSLSEIEFYSYKLHLKYIILLLYLLQAQKKLVFLPQA